MRNGTKDRGRWARLLALATALVLALTAVGLAEGDLSAELIQDEVVELGELELMAPAADESFEQPEMKAAPVLTAEPVPEVIEAQPKASTTVPKKLTLGVKETYTLKVSGAKKYATSNKKVATVSKKGVITAKKKGTATITVTNKKGKKTKVKVTVKKAPSKVTMKPKTLALEVGQTAQLTAKLPSKTASYKLTWKSKDKAIAKVSSKGVVTAVAPGTVKITVKTFNKKSATCTVTVTAPVVTPEPTMAPIGENSDPAQVQAVQQLLVRLGLLPEGGVTGQYDEPTKQAVAQFQQWAAAQGSAVPQDGIVDANTLAALQQSAGTADIQAPDSVIWRLDGRLVSGERHDTRRAGRLASCG